MLTFAAPETIKSNINSQNYLFVTTVRTTQQHIMKIIFVKSFSHFDN